MNLKYYPLSIEKHKNVILSNNKKTLLENKLETFFENLQKNNKNNLFNSYIGKLTPLLIEEIKKNNITKEIKKDIEYENQKLIRSSKFNNYISAYSFALSLFSLGISLLISAPLYMYIELNANYNQEIYLFFRSISTILLLIFLISSILSIPFFTLGKIQSFLFNKNIKNNNYISTINNNIKEKIIESTSKIKNERNSEIIESFNSYINNDQKLTLKERFLRKFMLFEVKKDFYYSILHDCEKGIKSKRLKP